jgi:hypothetical protein
MSQARIKRYFNRFQERTWNKAEEMGLEPSGIPQSEDKDILQNGGACVGLVLKKCSNDKCFKEGLEFQKKFEAKAKGESSLQKQAEVAAAISGDAAVSAEFVSSAKIAEQLSEKTKEFSQKGSFISIFNGRNGDHAIGLDVLSNKKCRLRDPNMGAVKGACNDVMDFAEYLQGQEYRASSSAIAPLRGFRFQN